MYWLFRLYLRLFVWLRFSALRVAREGMPDGNEGHKLVVYSNHPSWWDPAIYVLAAGRLFPNRAIFGPMAAAELEQWSFFRRLGAFGVAPGRRGAATFLRVAVQGLRDPRAALWITAEGAFTDARLRPLQLRPGIAHLARHVPDAVFLPLALEYVFWNDSRPEALLRFGTPVTGGAGSVADHATRLTNALTETMDRLAQDAASRDPDRFTTILPGATQTGLFFQKQRRRAPA